MQTAGPYRLQRPLSACDVGDVWSGVDDQGHSVTVAVLNDRASADERWRGAFAAAAEALGGAGADQLPITNADHDAARPWVACAVERGLGAAQIFVALGRQMEPVAAPVPEAPAADVPAPDAPVSGGPVARTPVSGAPAAADRQSGVQPSFPEASAGGGGEPHSAARPAAPEVSSTHAGAHAAVFDASAAVDQPTMTFAALRPAEHGDQAASRPAEASVAGADPATEVHTDHAPPADPAPEPHQAGVSPWELPPAQNRPADPPAPSYDDRTQLVPLVPRQQPAEPEPVADAPTYAGHPEATAAYPHQANGADVHLQQTTVDHPQQTSGAGPAYPQQTSGAGGYPHHAAHPQDAAAYAPNSPAYDYPAPHSAEPAPADHFGPVSAAPRSGAGGSMPVSADPFSPFPVSGGPETWQRSRVFGDQPPPKPKRNLLLLACVALVALLAGAGGAVAVMAARDGGEDPAPRPTRAAPLTPEQLLLPAAAPAAPGVEPPQGGGWPSSWPVFTSSESTKPINGLEGLGFDFQVPPGWNCTKQGQAEAGVRYRCGAGEGDEAAGGDLVVRTCEPVCDEAKRTQLRQREEAWGLRWTRSGPFTTWAETTEIDGKRLYGLVYVAFWRSVPEGQIDRQLVLRMTTPLATSDDLKKVANSIRDSTFTL